jgi:hypothetical protein
MARYQLRFVHKIAPRENDRAIAEIPDGAFADRKALGAALRKVEIGPPFYVGQTRALMSGERIRTFRVEGEKTIAFPSGGVWHAIVITPA